MKKNQIRSIFAAVLLGNSSLLIGEEAVKQKQPPLAVLATTYRPNSKGNLYNGYALESDPISVSTGEVNSGENVFSGFFYGVAVHPSGKFVYVTDNTSGVVYGGTVDSISGAVTPIPGAEYYLGGETYAVSIEASGRFLYVASTEDINTADARTLLFGAKIDQEHGSVETDFKLSRESAFCDAHGRGRANH